MRLLLRRNSSHFRRLQALASMRAAWKMMPVLEATGIVPFQMNLLHLDRGTMCVSSPVVHFSFLSCI